MKKYILKFIKQYFQIKLQVLYFIILDSYSYIFKIELRQTIIFKIGQQTRLLKYNSFKLKTNPF